MRTAGAAKSEPAVLNGKQDVTFDVRIPIRNCRLWSPEDPFLYDLKVSTESDVVHTRFGMRSLKLDSKSGRAILNGRPYYLRGTNVCIFRFFEDPAREDKPWRKDWVRELHRAFRGMHWNAARYCIGFPPERWYEIADEVGMLIQDEFPVWSLKEGTTGEILAEQYREWMRERWNHPCVVIWDAQNETQTPETGKAIRAVRGLDLSGRPWDNGWSEPQAPDDVYEAHPYVFANSSARFSNIGAQSPNALGNTVPNRGGNPIIINEYGWLWLDRDGTPTTLTRKVYENLLGSDALPAQRRVTYARYLAAETEFFRSQRRFAGVLHFCGLTYSRANGQTCDNFADIETLTFEPSFQKHVRDAFAPVGVMVDEWAEELIPGETRNIVVAAVNDLYEQADATVQLRMTGGEKTLAKSEQKCVIAPLGRTSLSFGVKIPQQPGKYQLVAELRTAGQDPVQSLRDFEVLTAEQKLARNGLAMKKPATASSVVTINGESFPAEYAVDGNRSTRWSSEFSDPQWIAIDLGQATAISRVELMWEAAFARSYTLEVSTDSQTWTEVYKTDKGSGGLETIRFNSTQARWVRLNCKRRATPYGYSLYEIRVFP
jgi:hypothetical protein